MAMRMQLRTMAPKEIPRITTKISLLGDWTRTPGRRGAAALVAADDALLLFDG